MDDTDVEKLLRDASTPAIFLAACDPGSSNSKLGGLPDVPTKFDWPTWNGRPLAFIAQIDLSALPRILGFDGLPRDGSLCFFYDQEQSTWGFDPKDLGSWRVVYAPAGTSLLKATAPPGLNSEAIYVEKFVHFEQVTSFPSLERLVSDLRSVSDEAFELGQELHSQSIPSGPEHQIGGYPSPVQGDGMELEAQLASNGLYCGNSSGYEDQRADSLRPGSVDWQLLLQVDSDDETGMMWGDCGRLYFWIRKQDLAAGEFSAAWMILQCS